MSRVRSFAITLAFGTISAFAGNITLPPPAANCGAGATIASLAGKSCSVGEFSYFNFSVLPIPILQPGSTSLVAQAGDIQVNIPALPGESVEFLSDKFEVKAGDRVLYLLRYTIDPPPPILPGFELDLFTETPNQPGTATISATVCAGGLLIANQNGGCLDIGAPNYQPNPYNLEVFHLGLPAGAIKLKDKLTFDKSVNLIDVQILIDLNAFLGGDSQIRGIGTKTGVVPEPGTWALMGAGLGGLALLRRRR